MTVNYELVSLRELKARSQATDNETLKKVSSWLESVMSWELQYKVFYDDSLVPIIEGLVPENTWRLAALKAFAPPVGDLTLNDWLTVINPKIEKANELFDGDRLRAVHPWHSRTRSRTRRADYTPDLGTGVTDRRSWRISDWRAEFIAGANSANPTKFQHYHEMLLTDAFLPTQKRKTFFHDFVLLNEFFWGRGQNFKGTLKEWLEATDEHDSELTQEIASFKVTEYTHTKDLINYYRTHSVASIASSNTKKQRDLLLGQERDVWLEMLRTYNDYTRGKTFDHTVQFLDETKRTLGKGTVLPYKMLTSSEIRRELILLLSEAVAFEGPYYGNAERLHTIATMGLIAIPTEEVLEEYAGEYSRVLHALKTKLEANQAKGELEALLRIEGEEDGSVNEDRALAQGKLTVQQAIGLLFASIYPRTWIRGNAQNGPFILADLIEASDDLKVLQLLAGIILEQHDTVPTEKEWRASMEAVNFSMPATFFIPLACSPAAIEKKQKSGYPDIVHRVRVWFGTPLPPHMKQRHIKF